MQLPADVVNWPGYGVWTEHDKKFLCRLPTRIAVSIITCSPKKEAGRVLSLVDQLLNARKLFTLVCAARKCPGHLKRWPLIYVADVDTDPRLLPCRVLFRAFVTSLSHQVSP
jgi:hypothetical protein